MENIRKFTALSLTIAVVSLSACSSSTMVTDTHSKVGFSNITDIPLPVSAKIDIHQSMVSGSTNNWTGHLVYASEKPQTQVIDYTNREMLDAGWTKVSELKGHETTITFIKEKRIVSFRLTTEKGYFSNSTVVAIDMANANLRQAIVQEEND